MGELLMPDVSAQQQPPAPEPQPRPAVDRGVGSSGRKPYGGRPHQSHCSCSYEVERLQAELEQCRQQLAAAQEVGFQAALTALGRWMTEQPRFADWGRQALFLSAAMQAVKDGARLDAAQQEPATMQPYYGHLPRAKRRHYPAPDATEQEPAASAEGGE